MAMTIVETYENSVRTSITIRKFTSPRVAKDLSNALKKDGADVEMGPQIISLEGGRATTAWVVRTPYQTIFCYGLTTDMLPFRFLDLLRTLDQITAMP